MNQTRGVLPEPFFFCLPTSLSESSSARDRRTCNLRRTMVESVPGCSGVCSPAESSEEVKSEPERLSSSSTVG